MKVYPESKAVYVLGNAPSLLDTDLKTLNSEITIGCNHLWKSGFIPTYYCVWDINFFNQLEDVESFLSLPTSFIFPQHMLLYLAKRGLVDMIKNVYFVKTSEKEFFDSTAYDPEFNEVCFTGGTITTVCIPFAVYLKATEIHLLGVEAGLKDTNEIKHFYPEVDYGEAIAKRLGVKYIPIVGHSQEVRDKTKRTWRHTKRILKHHKVKLNY